MPRHLFKHWYWNEFLLFPPLTYIVQVSHPQRRTGFCRVLSSFTLLLLLGCFGLQVFVSQAPEGSFIFTQPAFYIFRCPSWVALKNTTSLTSTVSSVEILVAAVHRISLTLWAVSVSLFFSATDYTLSIGVLSKTDHINEKKWNLHLILMATVDIAQGTFPS